MFSEKIIEKGDLFVDSFAFNQYRQIQAWEQAFDGNRKAKNYMLILQVMSSAELDLDEKLKQIQLIANASVKNAPGLFKQLCGQGRSTLTQQRYTDLLRIFQAQEPMRTFRQDIAHNLAQLSFATSASSASMMRPMAGWIPGYLQKLRMLRVENPAGFDAVIQTQAEYERLAKLFPAWQDDHSGTALLDGRH